jgi:hypothetical protein
LKVWSGERGGFHAQLPRAAGWSKACEQHHVKSHKDRAISSRLGHLVLIN